jgi:hypothetical protein
MAAAQRWHWEAVLGDGIGRQRCVVLKMQQQHWVALAAKEHAMMASVSASSKPRANYYNVGISIGKDGKRGRV